MYIEIPTEVEFSAIAFKSANDVPRRDPEKANVEIWSNEQWNAIDSFDLDFENRRWHTLQFSVPLSKTNKLRVTFTNPNFSQIQLGEILLLE